MFVTRIARSRLWLGMAIAVVIVLGLASRKYPALFPAALGKYPGDALWALAVFLGLAFVWPRWSSLRLAGVGLLIAYLGEFSQLYHAPWIDAIRATSIGHAAIGSGFSWIDMIAYTVGIAIGVAIDAATQALRRTPK